MSKYTNMIIFTFYSQERGWWNTVGKINHCNLTAKQDMFDHLEFKEDLVENVGF